MAARNITPDQLAGTPLSSSVRLNVDGTLFDFQNSYKSHSITYLGNDALRFELRDGDQFEWDKRSGVTSERDQLGSKTLFANQEAVNVSFGLNIEAGAPNTAKWLVLGQLHLAEWTGNLTGKSPPMEIGLDGERMVIYARYDKPDGTVVKELVYSDLHDIQRGHEYQIDIKAVFDPAGNGRLVVTRDGTMLTDYSGPLGYQQQLKVFWGEGIYREGGATETMAAQFSDLEIKTGSSVAFPDKSAFIAAPTLAVDHVGNAAADGSRIVDVSGVAKAGTTVTISEGGHALGRAQVDANGHYSVAIKIDKGMETDLSAIATDSTGRSGLEAKAQSVVIGTGAQIGAQLKDLIASGNIASIVITDGTVVTAVPATFSYILKYGQDTLSKIQGDFTFFNSTKVTGQSYDQQDFHYTAAGVLTEKIRYAAGQKVFDETYKVDGSIHQISRNSAGGTDVKDISKAGVITRFEQYLSDGKLSILQIKNPNGTSEQHLYDAKTGLETRYTLTAADGSTEVGQLELKGRAFVKEVYNYDKSGKMLEQHRYDADGTQIFQQVWNTNGSRQIDNFDAVTGLRTSFSVWATNGSRVETTLAAGDPYHIVKTIAYSAAGVVISVTEGGALPRPVVPAEPTPPVHEAPASTPEATTPVTTPAPVPPTPAPPIPSPPVTSTPATPTQPPVETGPKITYVVDAKTGLKTSSTEIRTDGSKEVLDFNPAASGKVLARTVYAADGHKLVAETFDTAGVKTWTASYAADGSWVASQFAIKNKPYDMLTNAYNAEGKVVESTLTSHGRVTTITSFTADGGKVEKVFGLDGKVTSSVTSSTGSVVSKDVHDASGKHISLETFGADGTRDSKQYDVTTGALKFETVSHADKTRVETSYGIKDKPYTEQTIEYDSAGKVTEKSRYYGDANHTLQYHEEYKANGSSEIKSYDAAGREVSVVTTTATNVKDTFEFRYTGTGNDLSRAQHDHYEGGKKLWTDVTDQAGNHQQLSYANSVLTSNDHVTDTFTSGGRDTFVFGANSGKDAIWQFSVANATHDTIKFDHAGVDSFDDLQIASQGGRHTVISFGVDESITLYNVAPSQLKADFFLFV